MGTAAGPAGGGRGSHCWERQCQVLNADPGVQFHLGPAVLFCVTPRFLSPLSC